MFGECLNGCKVANMTLGVTSEVTLSTRKEATFASVLCYQPRAVAQHASLASVLHPIG